MKKPVFVLRHIKPDEIDRKYNLTVYQQRKEIETSITDDAHGHTVPVTIDPLCKNDANAIDGHRTKITDLSMSEHDEMTHFSFLDESKKDHQCVVTMKSFMTHEDLPPSTGVHCFWCRHNFLYRPIGCPIDFISKRMTKTYHSEITKDNYTLRENVTDAQLEHVQSEVIDKASELYTIKNEYQLQSRDYYLMDGLFCSFNCCLAFIRNNIQNPIYLHSENYLIKIYYDVFGNDSAPLVPAPSWRLLKDYGGHVTIDEFRKNFYKVDYFSIDNMVMPFPNSKPVGFLFEKQVKL